MAQVLLLKIGSEGLPTEHASGADEITLASFTVTGGGPVLSANLDMNNGNISDANDISFTDPTADGITRTDGTHAADSILMSDAENSISPASGAILFGTATDSADQLDAFRLPAVAGTPSATPADGGEGYLVWDSSNDRLYAWDGASWVDQSQATEATSLAANYTAAEILAIRDVVYVSSANNVSKADASAASTARVIGLAKAGAAAAAPVSIQFAGVVGGFSGLTAGAPQYLSETAGLITETVPTTSGAKIVRIGYAKSVTEVHLNFQDLGVRA